MAAIKSAFVLQPHATARCTAWEGTSGVLTKTIASDARTAGVLRTAARRAHPIVLWLVAVQGPRLHVRSIL